MLGNFLGGVNFQNENDSDLKCTWVGDFIKTREQLEDTQVEGEKGQQLANKNKFNKSLLYEYRVNLNQD